MFTFILVCICTLVSWYVEWNICCNPLWSRSGYPFMDFSITGTLIGVSILVGMILLAIWVTSKERYLRFCELKNLYRGATRRNYNSSLEKVDLDDVASYHTDLRFAKRNKKNIFAWGWYYKSWTKIDKIEIGG